MLYPQILSAHTKDLVHVTLLCALFPTGRDAPNEPQFFCESSGRVRQRFLGRGSALTEVTEFVFVSSHFHVSLSKNTRLCLLSYCEAVNLSPTPDQSPRRKETPLLP